MEKMNRIKTRVSIVSAVLLVIICVLCGCSESDEVGSETVDNERLKIVYSYDGFVRIFEDSDTGVQYLIQRQGGICPLYNANGTLYTGN